MTLIKKIKKSKDAILLKYKPIILNENLNFNKVS